MQQGRGWGLTDRPAMSEDNMARLPLRHDCCWQVRFGMGQRRLLAMVAICGLWLSGCASTPEAADAGPFPVKYREMAKDYLRKTLVDPYSVRDAEIAEPEVKSSFYLVDPAPAWMICVRYNAKNRLGGYAGFTENVLLVRGDRVTISINELTRGLPSSAICKGLRGRFAGNR